MRWNAAPRTSTDKALADPEVWHECFMIVPGKIGSQWVWLEPAMRRFTVVGTTGCEDIWGWEYKELESE